MCNIFDWLETRNNITECGLDLLKAKSHINKAEIYLEFYHKYITPEKKEECWRKYKKHLKKAEKIHDRWS